MRRPIWPLFLHPHTDHAFPQIHSQMESRDYSPGTWRTHPLHLVPPVPYAPSSPRTKETLDWVFLVSALNFSFWSDLGEDERFGVEWYEDGWHALEGPPDQRRTKVWKGYWCLLAAINRGATGLSCANRNGAALTDAL